MSGGIVAPVFSTIPSPAGTFASCPNAALGNKTDIIIVTKRIIFKSGLPSLVFYRCNIICAYIQ
jgi:hypothetical protein